ncbi:hypothetical protein F3Y22_tig00112000pilonHSYRG00216 [Hibiscus syriacus]|uniref:Uncharacterized protein n=1 Tax=Hibiscus syriacus TaxID=106335 RepID=A0A6A2XMG0_HIBSY|nr:hypothetical protein F3Y22_tig00112000pilonHSYRG00216 [Hibiscus syriacus]
MKYASIVPFVCSTFKLLNVWSDSWSFKVDIFGVVELVLDRVEASEHAGVSVYNALNWIKNPGTCPASFARLVKEIAHCVLDRNVIIRHIQRCANWEADKLAKSGIGLFDLQGSDVPQKQDPINTEAVPMDCCGDQEEDLAANSELVVYEQDPSSPGLVKVPKLSGFNEALAADSHAEPEHDSSTELPNSIPAENASNKSNIFNGDNNPKDQSLQNELNHDAGVFLPPKNDCHIADMEKEQTKPRGRSLPDAVSVEDTSVGGNIRGLLWFRIE